MFELQELFTTKDTVAIRNAHGGDTVQVTEFQGKPVVTMKDDLVNHLHGVVNQARERVGPFGPVVTQVVKHSEVVS